MQGMKKINLSISKKGSIARAIKELEAYRDSLDHKTEMFIDRLGVIGIEALKVRLGNISPFYKGEDAQADGELVKTDEGWTAIIYLSGSQCAFIEFGAGVTFNGEAGSSKHPKGKELGMTIGSYNPSSPNATSGNGWWYKDKWGESQFTYGTPTFAPLYESSLEMIKEIAKVAREVFGNG